VYYEAELSLQVVNAALDTVTPSSMYTYVLWSTFTSQGPNGPGFSTLAPVITGPTGNSGITDSLVYCAVSNIQQAAAAADDVIFIARWTKNDLQFETQSPGNTTWIAYTWPIGTIVSCKVLVQAS